MCVYVCVCVCVCACVRVCACAREFSVLTCKVGIQTTMIVVTFYLFALIFPASTNKHRNTNDSGSHDRFSFLFIA